MFEVFGALGGLALFIAKGIGEDSRRTELAIYENKIGMNMERENYLRYVRCKTPEECQKFRDDVADAVEKLGPRDMTPQERRKLGYKMTEVHFPHSPDEARGMMEEEDIRMMAIAEGWTFGDFDKLYNTDKKLRRLNKIKARPWYDDGTYNTTYDDNKWLERYFRERRSWFGM